MSDYRFICNHCGKSFQLETPEAKECPFCFWASSVKREEEAREEKKRVPSARPGPKPRFPKSAFWGKIFFFLAVLSGVIFLGYQLYAKWKPEGKKAENPVLISSDDIKKIETDRKKIEAVAAALSPEDKEILSREVTVPENAGPGTEEKELLARTVEFKTGWSEKLPSTIWTLEQYQQMIREQESFYKMPFARSYRKKLEELFTANYVPAGEAFAQGDLLTARDLWVASLAFPLYSKDLLKHRAVALTMLRSFINDTLAKIGYLNRALAAKEVHDREEALNIAYQNLSGLIAQGKWNEAIQTIDQMEPAIDQLNAVSKKSVAPPPYPPAIAMVDQDIQRPLADLLTPAPVSVANLLNLKQDLAIKQDILAGLTGQQLEDSQKTYQDALEMIRQERWETALDTLNSIHSPEVLKDDAKAKAAILQKITGRGLDSSEGAG